MHQQNAENDVLCSVKRFLIDDCGSAVTRCQENKLETDRCQKNQTG